MMNGNSFYVLGFSHIICLAITVFLTVVFIALGRRFESSKIPDFFSYALGFILLATYGVYNVMRYQNGHWRLRYDLPMELCDWAGIAVIIACFTRNQIAFEISYFWIMAGSIHGTLTPNLDVDFPDPFFFIYFVSHIALVVASFYFIFGLRIRPKPGAVWRIFWISQIYFVTALGTNWILGGNYGYLMRKPTNPSVLDYLGEWPYYWISLELAGLVIFSLLYLPFYFSNRRMSLGKSPVQKAPLQKTEPFT